MYGDIWHSEQVAFQRGHLRVRGTDLGFPPECERQQEIPDSALTGRSLARGCDTPDRGGRTLAPPLTTAET